MELLVILAIVLLVGAVLLVRRMRGQRRPGDPLSPGNDGK